MHTFYVINKKLKGPIMLLQLFRLKNTQKALYGPCLAQTSVPSALLQNHDLKLMF